MQEQEQSEYVPDTQPMISEAEVEATTLDSTKVRKQIIEIKEQIGADYKELCRLLRYVQMKQLYINWGYPTFKEYVCRELEFKVTKALYLASLWKNLSENQPETVFQKVMALGWSKAKELQRVVTQENVDYWVEKGSHLSVDALSKEVKTELAKKVPDDPKEALAKESEVQGTPVAEQPKTISFTFQYEDYLTVSSALDSISNAYPAMSKGAMLSLACGEYLGGNPGEHKDSERFALDIVKRMSAIHDWDIVIRNRTTKEMLVGLEGMAAIVNDIKGEENGDSEGVVDPGV